MQHTLILALGKRLVNNQLTLEGESRVSALVEIERTILETTPDAPVDQVQHALRILHPQLTRLNRHFDPEQPFKV
ncbi:hypothetical protein [Vibrio fluvialis]|uniref:hypothetical protein n=1 Tax=Vibrio fluvialis TaxID=676 RepID=UPI0005C97D06|nr:hypothetical protein [Vibrio fluvialis]